MPVRIEYMPLADLVERFHPDNPKDHSISDITNSMMTLGYREPVMIDERSGLLAAGHGRLKTLSSMYQQQMDVPQDIQVNGDDWMVPVVRGSEFTAEQLQAYLVASNELTMAGGWDEPKLAELLQGVAGVSEELLVSTGFSGEKLDELLSDLGMKEIPDDPGAQVDRAAELQEVWCVERGQVWEIESKMGEGFHRVMCGDSTCEEDVARLMDGEKAELLLADPPYGQLKIFNSSGAVGNAGDNLAKVKNYGSYHGHKTFDLSVLLESLKGYHNKSVIWGGNYFTDILPITASWLVWDKRAGKQLFYADCELAWSDLGITAKVFDFVWQGMIRSGGKIERVHPTQKPVELYEWVLSLGEFKTVLDPTMGSGSAMVACEMSGIICFGIEIDPAYCAVVLERMAGLGLSPVLVKEPSGEHVKLDMTRTAEGDEVV